MSFLGGAFDGVGIGTGQETDALYAKAGQDVVDKELSAAVNGVAVNNHVAGTEEAEQRRGDGRHAAAEHQTAFRLVPQRQPILKDFQVWVVESGIDEPGVFGRTFFPKSIGKLEKCLALLRRSKGEGRGLKDRTLNRAFRKAGVVTVAHHQGLGTKLMTTDRSMTIGFTGFFHHWVLACGQGTPLIPQW